MKTLILVGLLTAATAPAAFATEDANCPVDNERHVATAQAHSDAQPPDAQRSHKETWMPAALADMPIAAAAPASNAPAVPPPPRQRVQKHPRTIEAGVPDSVLIGGSGAL